MAAIRASLQFTERSVDGRTANTERARNHSRSKPAPRCAAVSLRQGINEHRSTNNQVSQAAAYYALA
jgi:hypothetical protein